MSKNVTVYVHDKLNLEQCQKVLAAVLTKAGHTGCFSGFKIGFENVVEGSHLQSLNRGLGTGKSCKKDELAAERGFAKFTEEVDSRHVRHLDVGDNEIEFRGLQLRERFFSAGGADDHETFFLQKDFEQFT